MVAARSECGGQSRYRDLANINRRADRLSPLRIRETVASDTPITVASSLLVKPSWDAALSVALVRTAAGSADARRGLVRNITAYISIEII